MRQSGYAIALAFVLVAMVAGAFFGGRWAVQRFRQDFQFREHLSPAGQPTSGAPEATEPPATEAAAPTERPSATLIVIPTPIAPTPEPFSPQPEPTARPTKSATSAPAETVPAQTAVAGDSTVLPSPEPIVRSADPFQPKGAVRYSLGDCGGTYSLGFVTDRSGAPLTGVRLRLVDEFENEALAATKSGQADLGRYDFPIAGPPRRFSIVVIDQAGSPLSRPVGFTFYGDAADAQATCYWLDWQLR
jgi:hypothetical protein